MAGSSAIRQKAPTTWAGVLPSALRTPILNRAPATAPLTTFVMIRIAVVRARMPKAMMNGTHGAVLRWAWYWVARYVSAPTSAPVGSMWVIAVRAASSSLSVPARVKR